MDFLMFMLGSVLTGIGILAVQNFTLPRSELEDNDDPRDELIRQLVTAQAEQNGQLMSLVRTLAVHERGAERTATVLASADTVREEIPPGTRRNGHIVPEREADLHDLEREAGDMADEQRRMWGDVRPTQDHMSLLARQFAGIQTPDGGQMVDPR